MCGTKQENRDEQSDVQHIAMYLGYSVAFLKPVAVKLRVQITFSAAQPAGPRGSE